MGAFITNYQIRCDSPDRVAAKLMEMSKAGAYVSTNRNGWISIYDEASNQDPAEMRRIARQLSRQLASPIFAFLVHDSDYFYYLLYDNGQLLDEYDSDPDYFGEVEREIHEQLKGKPKSVLKYCRSAVTLAQVEIALARSLQNYKMVDLKTQFGQLPLMENGEFIFAEDRLRLLARLLGINIERACLSFNTIESMKQKDKDYLNGWIEVATDE